MISRKASILPARLARKYKSNDPFEIAEALDIEVLERSDFKRQKEMKRLVCAHELGHALLHRSLGKSETGLMEFELFDITSTTEYEANLFAANLLLDESSIEELVSDGLDIVQIARQLGTNVNLLLLKLQQMNDDNRFRLPDMPDRNFLGVISDDAGHL